MRNILNSVGTVRRLLALFGLGATAVALGSVAAPNQVFAKQFVRDATSTTLPKMVYDPKTQMMVNPATQAPIYENAQKILLALPTVTAGCSDCPKKDDDGPNFM